MINIIEIRKRMEKLFGVYLAEKELFHPEKTGSQNLTVKKIITILLQVYLPMACVLALAKLQTQVPFENLARDPLAIMNAPFYIGILSTTGVLLWCSSAAICLFSFAVLKTDRNSTRRASFFLYSGLFLSVLLLDDVFLLHEAVIPTYLHIPSKFLYTVYAVLMLLYLVKYRKTILKTDFILLAFPLGFFSISIIFDVLEDSSIHLVAGTFFEDGSKLLGIVGISAYFIKVCIKEVRCKILRSISLLQKDGV